MFACAEPRTSVMTPENISLIGPAVQEQSGQTDTHTHRHPLKKFSDSRRVSDFASLSQIKIFSVLTSLKGGLQSKISKNRFFLLLHKKSKHPFLRRRPKTAFQNSKNCSFWSLYSACLHQVKQAAAELQTRFSRNDKSHLVPRLQSANLELQS